MLNNENNDQVFPFYAVALGTKWDKVLLPLTGHKVKQSVHSSFFTYIQKVQDFQMF